MWGSVLFPRPADAHHAEAAGLVDADDFACSWHIPTKGSIIAATEGDLQAAYRA
jgi:hypothetical protein